MKTHLQHKFQSVRQYTPLFMVPYVTFYYARAKSVLAEKNVCRCGRTGILTDSVKKGNRKEVLANYIKTRINIGHQHDRWMELKEALRA